MSGYHCNIDYLSGKYNTGMDLLSRILKQLETESVRVEPEVDDRAYQIHVINSNRLKIHPVLETDRRDLTAL